MSHSLSCHRSCARHKLSLRLVADCEECLKDRQTEFCHERSTIICGTAKNSQEICWIHLSIIRRAWLELLMSYCIKIQSIIPSTIFMAWQVSSGKKVIVAECEKKGKKNLNFEISRLMVFRHFKLRVTQQVSPSPECPIQLITPPN